MYALAAIGMATLLYLYVRGLLWLWRWAEGLETREIIDARVEEVASEPADGSEPAADAA